jgi:hypothetical protein
MGREERETGFGVWLCLKREIAEMCVIISIKL